MIQQTFSIIIPAFNEESLIRSVVNEVQKVFCKSIYEIIVINNNSVDGTLDVLRSISNINIFNYYEFQSRSKAIIYGLKKAKNDYVVIVDGDGEIELDYLNEIITADLRSNIYWGDRFDKVEKSTIPMVLNHLVTKVINYMYGTSVNDSMCGYLIIPKETALRMNLQSSGWNFNAEVLSKFKRHNNIINIPVNYTRRLKKDGKKISAVDYLYTFLNVFLLYFNSNRFYEINTRIYDIVLSLLALIFLTPVLIISCLFIFIDSYHNPIYSQKRVGKNGVDFTIYKLRSMVNNNGDIYTQKDDNRITRTGKFIRKYKIDELPQLVNILMGNMSIIGPRPDLRKNIDLICEADRRIMLSVRPGLVDYASLKYFNEDLIDKKMIDINEILEDKVRLSKECIYYSSISNYFKIIVLTLKKFLGL